MSHSSSKKNKGKGNHRKEKVKCSYCGKGFHPEHACMKKKLNESTSLLERNNINLSKERKSRSGIPAWKRSCPHRKNFEFRVYTHRFWSFKPHDFQQILFLFSWHQQENSHPHGRWLYHHLKRTRYSKSWAWLFFQCFVSTISCIKPPKCLSNDPYGSSQEIILHPWWCINYWTCIWETCGKRICKSSCKSLWVFPLCG